MKDIDAEEMARRQWVYSKFREICNKFGFREASPVEIENFETLAAKAGADIDQEVYSFTDKGGRKLGLRFDLTLGLTRMIATSSLPMPQKISCIGQMWRYDAPQFGRYRCFWSWDIEVFGSKEIQADAEIIAFTTELTKALGIDFEIRINSRTLIEGILNYLGIKGKKQLEDAMRTIDKIEKLSRQELYLEFKNNGFEKIQADEILNALSRKGKPEDVLKQIKKDFPKEDARPLEKVATGIKELEELINALKGYGVLNSCTLDLSIVRGLAYYTGIVFEVYDKKNEKLGALAGGGRFDNLVKIYGKDVPATGVAGGIERLLLAIEENKAFPKLDIKPDFYVIAVDKELKAKAQEIAQKLRDAGLSADCDIMSRSLSAQIEYASKMKIPKVLIVGKDEIKENKVTLRDMNSGKQDKISLEKVIKPGPTELELTISENKNLKKKLDEIISKSEKKIFELEKKVSEQEKRIKELEIAKTDAEKTMTLAQREKDALEKVLRKSEEELEAARKAREELLRKK